MPYIKISYDWTISILLGTKSGIASSSRPGCIKFMLQHLGDLIEITIQNCHSWIFLMYKTPSHGMGHEGRFICFAETV